MSEDNKKELAPVLATDDEGTPLTKESAYQLIGEVVGQSLDEFSAQQKEVRNKAMEEIRYAMAQTKPKEQKRTKEEIKENFGLYLGCLAQEKGDLKAASIAAKQYGNEYVSKALATTTTAAGGAIVTPEFAAEIIPLLRANTVVLELGARVVPMESGILHYGRVGSGATAAYRGESVATAASEPTLEEVILTAKILDVLVPASTQLLNRTKGRGASMIMEDASAAVKDKMDSSFIRGTGTAHVPKGITNWIQSANKFDEINVAGTAGGSTAAEIIKTLGKSIRLLKDLNIPGVSLGWLFAPRTWQGLFTLVDANSNYIFRPELQSGYIYNIPWRDTTNIPTNLTDVAAGSNGSELILADFFQFLVGETEGMEVSVSTEASYTVSGSLVSAFERGEVLTKVSMEHDFADRHGGKSAVLVEKVSWGY